MPRPLTEITEIATALGTLVPDLAHGIAEALGLIRFRQRSSERRDVLDAIQPSADGVVRIHEFQVRGHRHAASMGGLSHDSDQFQRQAVIRFND